MLAQRPASISSSTTTTHDLDYTTTCRQLASKSKGEIGGATRLLQPLIANLA